MGLRILEEEAEMDHTREILLVAGEVVGIGEGDKSIVITIVAMVTEIMIVEVVEELTTMTVVDHPSVVTMV